MLLRTDRKYTSWNYVYGTWHIDILVYVWFCRYYYMSF